MAVYGTECYNIRSLRSVLHYIDKTPWKPCPIYTLMIERGQLQSGDGSAGPRRVGEAPFQVEGRPHYQKMNAKTRGALPPPNAPPVVRPSCAKKDQCRNDAVVF